MHVILGRTAHCPSQWLESLIKALGCPRADESVLAQATNSNGSRAPEALNNLPDRTLISAESIGGLGSIENWLAETDATHLLAVHTPPESGIAHGISHEGKSLDETIHSWTESARALLRVIRRNRARTTLFDASAAYASQEEFRTKAAERLCLDANRATSSAAPDLESSPSALYRVIAAQAVAQSLELQDLRDELEASAIPLASGESTDMRACNQALDELLAREQKRQNLEEENELLLLQLHQVQEELETYYLEAQDKEKERKKLVDENESLNKRCEDLKKQVDRLEGDVKKTTKQRDWAKHHMDKMKNSTSWKLTASLRAIRGRNRGARPSAEA